MISLLMIPTRMCNGHGNGVAGISTIHPESSAPRTMPPQWLPVLLRATHELRCQHGHHNRRRPDLFLRRPDQDALRNWGALRHTRRHKLPRAGLRARAWRRLRGEGPSGCHVPLHDLATAVATATVAQPAAAVSAAARRRRRSPPTWSYFWRSPVPRRPYNALVGLPPLPLIARALLARSAVVPLCTVPLCKVPLCTTSLCANALCNADEGGGVVQKASSAKPAGPYL